MSDHASDEHEHWGWSPWPFLASIAVLFFAVMPFSFFFVYDMPQAAIVTLGIGVIMLVAALIGWTKEAIGDPLGEGFAISAMPYFIVAEAFIFVGFFATYWATRLPHESWPPAGTPEHMPLTIPLAMTVLLVSSSFTMHFAEEKLHKGDKGGFKVLLIVTMALGALFLGLSMSEWSTLIGEGFTISTNLYGSAFYSITGFHGSHVIVGLIMFSAILLPALMSGKINETMVQCSSLYWHFVDIVWFFVVSQIYFW